MLQYRIEQADGLTVTNKANLYGSFICKLLIILTHTSSDNDYCTGRNTQAIFILFLFIIKRYFAFYLCCRFLLWTYGNLEKTFSQVSNRTNVTINPNSAKDFQSQCRVIWKYILVKIQHSSCRTQHDRNLERIEDFYSPLCSITQTVET